MKPIVLGLVVLLAGPGSFGATPPFVAVAHEAGREAARVVFPQRSNPLLDRCLREAREARDECMERGEEDCEEDYRRREATCETVHPPPETDEAELASRIAATGALDDIGDGAWWFFTACLAALLVYVITLEEPVDELN